MKEENNSKRGGFPPRRKKESVVIRKRRERKLFLMARLGVGRENFFIILSYRKKGEGGRS